MNHRRYGRRRTEPQRPTEAINAFSALDEPYDDELERINRQLDEIAAEHQPAHATIPQPERTDR